MDEYIKRHNAVIAALRALPDKNDTFAAIDIVQALNKLPAADVAPRVELAMEIFKEIEEIADTHFGTYSVLSTKDYVDLKKKYTGIKKGGAKLINKNGDEILSFGEALKIEQQLIEKRMFIPPVMIGQTVYAALIFDESDELNKCSIEEYTAGGVGYIDGEWLVYCKKDRDWYKYGTELCKPTREEAEAVIAAARSAADIKDGHKNGGAE